MRSKHDYNISPFRNRQVFREYKNRLSSCKITIKWVDCVITKNKRRYQSQKARVQFISECAHYKEKSKIHDVIYGYI